MMQLWDSLSLWYLAAPFFMASLAASLPAAFPVQLIKFFFVGCNLLVCTIGIYGGWNTAPLLQYWAITPALWSDYLVLALLYAASLAWGYTTPIPLALPAKSSIHAQWISWCGIGCIQLALAGLTLEIKMLCLLLPLSGSGFGVFFKMPFLRGSSQFAYHKMFFACIVSWVVMMTGLVCLVYGQGSSPSLVLQKQATVLFYLGAFLLAGIPALTFFSSAEVEKEQKAEHGLFCFSLISVALLLLQFDQYNTTLRAEKLLVFIHTLNEYVGAVLLLCACIPLKKWRLTGRVFVCEAGLVLIGMGRGDANGLVASLLIISTLALLTPGLHYYAQASGKKDTLSYGLGYVCSGLPPIGLFLGHYLLLESVFLQTPFAAFLLLGVLVYNACLVVNNTSGLAETENPTITSAPLLSVQGWIKGVKVFAIIIGPYMLIIPYYHSAHLFFQFGG